MQRLHTSCNMKVCKKSKRFWGSKKAETNHGAQAGIRNPELGMLSLCILCRAWTVAFYLHSAANFSARTKALANPSSDKM